MLKTPNEVNLIDIFIFENIFLLTMSKSIRYEEHVQSNRYTRKIFFFLLLFGSFYIRRHFREDDSEIELFFDVLFRSV